MNGIIVLNKPAGCTSFEAVRAVSRLFSKEKAGHSGTLDPMATGVLPVFLGRATKLIPYLPDTDKEYIADLAFGTKTDTGDIEGKPLLSSIVRPTEEKWKVAMLDHLGAQAQIPPMYSAIKKNGVPLYDLARQGKVIERESRQIIISELETLYFDGETARIRVRCSAGTYIRTLAEDLAAVCGAFAHLISLQRTRACGFFIENAVTLDELEKTENRNNFLINPEVWLDKYPTLLLDDNLTRLFINGFLFPIERTGSRYEMGTRLRVYNNGRFIALGEITDHAELKKLWQS